MNEIEIEKDNNKELNSLRNFMFSLDNEIETKEEKVISIDSIFFNSINCKISATPI
jgi:hypothetical protein